MNGAEVLNAYRKATLELEELQRQLEHATPTGRPSGYRSGLRAEEGGGTNNAMAAAMQLADGLSDLIRRKREELAGLTPRVFELLGGIGDGREFQIVQQYYLMGETDEGVAKALGLSYSRVGQIRRRFLARVS